MACQTETASAVQVEVVRLKLLTTGFYTSSSECHRVESHSARNARKHHWAINKQFVLTWRWKAWPATAILWMCAAYIAWSKNNVPKSASQTGCSLTVQMEINAFYQYEATAELVTMGTPKKRLYYIWKLRTNKPTYTYHTCCMHRSVSTFVHFCCCLIINGSRLHGKMLAWPSICEATGFKAVFEKRMGAPHGKHDSTKNCFIDFKSHNKRKIMGLITLVSW